VFSCTCGKTGTIDKILISKLDGKVVPHVRGNGGRVYAISVDTTTASNLYTRQYRSGVGNNAEEVVIFQGEAAQQFKDYSERIIGAHTALKHLRKIQVSDPGYVVIDEFTRNRNTLIVTKAHLAPLPEKGAAEMGRVWFWDNSGKELKNYGILIGESVILEGIAYELDKAGKAKK